MSYRGRGEEQVSDAMKVVNQEFSLVHGGQSRYSRLSLPCRVACDVPDLDTSCSACRPSQQPSS